MRRAGLSIALLALSGCARASKLATPPEAACDKDSDCAAGQVCLEIGCAFPDHDLAVQIRPSGAALLPEDFSQVDTRGGTMGFQLDPPPGVELSSAVPSFSLDIAGHSLFIPGIDYSQQALNLPGSGTIHLPMGQYTLRAAPSDPALPPAQLAVSLSQAGQVQPLTLQFADPSTVLTVSGRILAPNLHVGDPAWPTPVALDVQAFRPGPDGVALSQPAAVKSDNGVLRFSLSLSPVAESDPLDLVVTPVQGPAPSLTYATDLAGLRAMNGPDGGIDLSDLTPAGVQGAIQGGTRQPIAGARVILEGTLEGGATFHSDAAITGANGGYQATVLLPAHAGITYAYQALVIPPTGIDAAVTLSDVIPADAHTADLGTTTLQPLTRVTGRVRSPQGAPAAGAVVAAEPLGGGAAGGPTAPLPLSNATTSTGNDGTYALSLTPGTYRFTFSAPVSLQAPSNSRGPKPIAGAQVDLGDFEFSSPRLVNGTVRGPDGSPLGGALVNVFQVLEVAGDSNAPRRSTLLATAHVQSDGSFGIILPAPRQ